MNGSLERCSRTRASRLPFRCRRRHPSAFSRRRAQWRSVAGGVGEGGLPVRARTDRVDANRAARQDDFPHCRKSSARAPCAPRHGPRRFRMIRRDATESRQILRHSRRALPPDLPSRPCRAAPKKAARRHRPARTRGAASRYENSRHDEPRPLTSPLGRRRLPRLCEASRSPANRRPKKSRETAGSRLGISRVQDARDLRVGAAGPWNGQTS